MKFHTNLPPSECLKRLKKPVVNSDCAVKEAVKRKYGSYFSSPLYEAIQGQRICTDVDTDKFEVSFAKWGLDRHGWYINVVQTKYSGTIVENEDGGSTVEFRLTHCDMSLVIYFFIIVVLIFTIIMMALGFTQDPPDPGFYYGIAQIDMYMMSLVLFTSIPFYIFSIMTRRLLIVFIKDLLEINGHQIVVDQNEQAKQPIMRLKKKQTGKHK
jgi:hypothetical protein